MVGECILKYIDDTQKYPMIVSYKKGGMISFTQHGSYFDNVGECILFPSKRCRDWSLFVKRRNIRYWMWYILLYKRNRKSYRWCCNIYI